MSKFKSVNMLGEELIIRGFLTPEKLEAALFEQKVTHEKLGKILIRNGFSRQKEVISVIRDINPALLIAESIIVREIPSDLLIETRTMVVADLPDQIYVATMGSKSLVKKRLTPFVGKREIIFVPTSPQRLDDYLVELSNENNQDGETLEKMLRDSLSSNTSDIHIIPRHSSYTVMNRRFGVMKLVHEGSVEDYISLASRIKDKCGMDMAERRRSQDGSFSFDYNGRVIDLRVVTIPTVEGERIVLRILDPDSVKPRLDDLGISQLVDWRRAVSRPDGICLICGPTGSGKTTTLNATIREMNFLERSIYTVEDPVEYRLPYAGQVNANASTGMDFAGAVRGFLRADPDVIIVGEVRDADTARIAIKAAETGHMVIATLHTSSIIGSISRLRDIGVPPQDLRYLLRGVMVQRLARLICKTCHGKGCKECGKSGYFDRTIVSEGVYLPDEHAVDRLIAGEVHWQTMLGDAQNKMAQGLTNLTELRRVFGAQVDDEVFLSGVDNGSL